MKIRIGVGLGVGHTLDSPAALGSVVDLLESSGFDSLWMSDRVVGAALDPIAALAYAAGRTERLKLGTNVLVLPGRDPFLMARQLAAIDQLSGGRLLPAVGLGSPSRADRPPFGVPAASGPRCSRTGSPSSASSGARAAPSPTRPAARRFASTLGRPSRSRSGSADAATRRYAGRVA